MAFSWRNPFRKSNPYMAEAMAELDREFPADLPETKIAAQERQGGFSLSRRTQTKSLTIIDDGFIPRDVITMADLMTGRAEEGLDSNVVMAPVAWIMRTFTEARARVQDVSNEDSPEWIPRHPVEQLIRRPNPWYNGTALWQATTLSYVLNGNAYWQKVRNSFGQVIQLWYRPHWRVKPVSPPDGSAFISHYEYDTGRGVQRLNVRDVVHFRFALDPRDPRYGYAPLRPLLREMFSDQEAARFTMRLLENNAIPGIVVSPTHSPTGEAFDPERDNVDALKTYLETEFTGNGRGKPLVFGHPTSVSQFGFDPNQMTLPDLRNNAEERVCAMLGVPAAVVGFRSGMEQTKVGATMAELVKLAWKQCLFPMQGTMGEQLDDQLLSDFTPDYDGRESVVFDASRASSLKESGIEAAQRVTALVGAGVMRVDHAQAELGLEVDDTQKVYIRPLTVMTVPAEVEPEPMVHPNSEQAAEMAADQMAAGEDEDVKALAAKLLARMAGVKTDAPVETVTVDQAVAELAEETVGNGNGHHNDDTEGTLDVAA